MAGEEWTSANQKRSSTGLNDLCECRIEVTLACDLHGHNLPPENATRRLHIQQRVFAKGVVRIKEYGDRGALRSQLIQQLQPFLVECTASEEGYTCDVASRSAEVSDEAAPDGIVTGHEHDRDGRGGSLHRNAIADDCSHLPAYQISREARQLIELIVRPAILNRDVLAFNKPGFAQPVTKCCHKMGERSCRCAAQEADYRHRWLLCSGSKRPCCGRAYHYDELPPFHAVLFDRGGPRPFLLPNSGMLKGAVP